MVGMAYGFLSEGRKWNNISSFYLLLFFVPIPSCNLWVRIYFLYKRRPVRSLDRPTFPFFRNLDFILPLRFIGVRASSSKSDCLVLIASRHDTHFLFFRPSVWATLVDWLFLSFMSNRSGEEWRWYKPSPPATTTTTTPPTATATAAAFGGRFEWASRRFGYRRESR